MIERLSVREPVSDAELTKELFKLLPVVEPVKEVNFFSSVESETESISDKSKKKQIKKEKLV